MKHMEDFKQGWKEESWARGVQKQIDQLWREYSMENISGEQFDKEYEKLLNELNKYA